MFSSSDIERMKIKLKNKAPYTDSVKSYLLGCDMPVKEKIIIALSELTSQMYGPFLQKIIISFLSLEEVGSTLNRGDGKTNTGKHYEIKTGLVNKGKIKLFQVRPYQDLEGEISVHYDAKNDELFCFLFPHQYIKDMCRSIGSSSHGAGEYRNEEKQIEININNLCGFATYRMSIEDIKSVIR